MVKTPISVLALALLVCSCATSTPPPLAPAILSRAQWHANAAVGTMKSHTVGRITIHHTATPQKPERALEEKMRALQKFSQNEGTLGNGKPKRAWPDVPYHYYIDCRGVIAEGRDIQFVGDTNTSYDPTGHALVVLEGNFEEEQPTEAQLHALRAMVAWLAGKYHVVPENIGAHRDFAETLCPGQNLLPHITGLRQGVHR